MEGQGVAEAEHIKPRTMLAEEAIAAALEGRWTDATQLNLSIVEHYGSDVETNNRLGKAFMEQGQYKEAHGMYGKSLEMDPYSPIAQKNIAKLEAMMQSKERVGSVSSSINVNLFTEEPGKSALTMLEQINKKETVRVVPGDTVDMEIDGGALRCRTARGVMLGEVEAKIARRLIPLMQAGNKYSAAVARATSDESVEIMIRETYQAPENARKASFPLTKSLKREDFRPYAKESLLHGADEAEMDEEEEEVEEEEASEAKPAAEAEVAKPEGAEGIEETPLEEEEEEKEKEEKETDQREEDKF